MFSYVISDEDRQDCINLSTGLFSPLNGFVNKEDFFSIVDRNCLSSGEPFTIPIPLSLPESLFTELKIEQEIILENRNQTVGRMIIEDKFIINNHQACIYKIYGTNSTDHPGVVKELQAGKFRIGGSIKINSEIIDNSF